MPLIGEHAQGIVCRRIAHRKVAGDPRVGVVDVGGEDITHHKLGLDVNSAGDRKREIVARVLGEPHRPVCCRIQGVDRRDIGISYAQVGREDDQAIIQIHYLVYLWKIYSRA